MKTIYYLNGKKTSKKSMIELFGKDRVNRLTKEAVNGFKSDPLEEQSFFLGTNRMLTIAFE